MAKLNIRSDQWGTIFASIENRGKTLEDEAKRLGVTVEDMIACGDEKFSRNPKRWETCKRLSEKRVKKQTPKKRKPAVPQNSTPARVPESTPTTPADPMEELLRKKEELQRKLTNCASSLEAAEAILAVRQGALTDARSVLEKAQHAVQQAESDEAEAQATAKQAQTEQATAQQELQGIEQEIKELREKTIYLVDPWFTGNLPEYGAFLSTVEMEGVKTQEVPEEYLPDATLDGVLLFDFVPDYKKARIFCGLVAKYELEETPYQLLVSDERVKKLLKMYIGK